MEKKQILSYIKLLEKYTGKKVKFSKKSLKEADEASKNEAVNNLQFISTSIKNVNDKIDEISDSPVIDKNIQKLLEEMQIQFEQYTHQIDTAIQDVIRGGSADQGHLFPLDEDIEMTTDDIIKNPQTVQKLQNGKVDVRVNDKLKKIQ